MRPCEGGGRRPGGHLRGALQHVVDDALLVDRVVRGLAHALVGERAFLGVQDQEPQVRPGLLVDRVAIALELGQRVGRHLDHQVDAAGQHLGGAGVGVGDRAEDHGLERRLAVPVVGVLLDHHGLVRTPFDKFEGPGTRRVAAEIGPVLLDRLGRGDQAGRIGEVRQERRVGRVQGEDDGHVVGGLDALDRAEEEAQRERPGVVIGVVLVENAIEVELHRLGVQRAAVVEGHALAQLEGVDGAVVADLPAFGQRGLHLERAVLVADQPVIDVHQDPEVVDRGDGVRVQRLRLGDLADDQDAGWRLRVGGRKGCKRERGGASKRGKPPAGD